MEVSAWIRQDRRSRMLFLIDPQPMQGTGTRSNDKKCGLDLLKPPSLMIDLVGCDQTRIRQKTEGD
jgi:hypothetical protein